MAQTNQVRAKALMNALDAFAKIEAPVPYWLGGKGADAGPSYCQDCAEKAVAGGKGEFVDGGWCNGDGEDSCCHCASCGRVLDYLLTEHGIKAELEHFQQDPPKAPLDPANAFHIARLVESAPENADVIRIAEAAMAAIAATGTSSSTEVLRS